MKFKSTTLALVCGAVALGVAALTFAKDAPVVKPTQPSVVSVKLYAQPQASAKVLESLKPNQALVPIYQKGEWIKVGNPRDGEVGWINKQQYRKAYNEFYRPNVQTVFIRDEQDKSGKPVVNIVAYRNGKKLDEKQAQVLYKHIQQQSRREMRAIHHFNHQMARFFAHEQAMFGQNFPGFMPVNFAPMMMQPVIVVEKPAEQAAVHSLSHHTQDTVVKK